jgi:hypothetical protein
MEHVRRIFTGEGPSDASEEGGFEPRNPSELHAARWALRTALHEKHDCSAEETRRIAAILQRAAAEIREKK